MSTLVRIMTMRHLLPWFSSIAALMVAPCIARNETPPTPQATTISEGDKVKSPRSQDKEWWKNTGHPKGQWWLTYPGYEPEEARKIWARVGIPPAPVLSAEDALKTFQVDQGFRVELVACEPMVIRPVFMRFDEAGRLWVAEMPGYMRDVAGTGEDAPTGRIVVLEDLNEDGRMDKSTVFLDKLVMPRTLAFVPGGVLVVEPPRIWYAQDKDGDLVADERIVVAEHYGERGNPEHSANGLLPAMDNWMYSAKSAERHRFSGGQLISEPTLFRGQWGIAQDDAGRLYYNYNASPLHADMVPGEYFLPVEGMDLSQSRNLRGPMLVNASLVDDNSVYPVRVTPLVTLGASDLRPDGTLKHFTAASAPHVYRASLYPEDYRGSVFVADPVGNLVKRFKLEWRGGQPKALATGHQREFLASSDERFRPVFMETGPEGALYVADMYTGIVEHKRYVTEYLREQILSREIGAFAPTGRIYRIVPTQARAPKPTKLDHASPEQLVRQLSSDNGWVRDTAQRLLVQGKSHQVVSMLRAMAKEDSNALGRLHALWTLAGLNEIDIPACEIASHDVHPWIRCAALRVSETLSTTMHPSLMDLYRRISSDPDIEVRLQLVLTLGAVRTPMALQLMIDMLEKECDMRMVSAVAAGMISAPIEAIRELMMLAGWEQETELRHVLLEQLGLIVMQRRNASMVSAVFSILSHKAATDWRVKAVLQGLAFKAASGSRLELPEEPRLFSSMRGTGGESVDKLLADLSAKLTWPGDPSQKAPTLRPLTPSEQTLFEIGREHYTSICAACHQSNGQGLNGVAPTLVRSEWVTNSHELPINIILHGVSGPIEVSGEKWNMVMPGLGSTGAQLDDAKIAGIVTYIRRQWGNMDSPVSPAEVARIRAKSRNRTAPWTAVELINLQKPNPL